MPEVHETLTTIQMLIVLSFSWNCVQLFVEVSCGLPTDSVDSQASCSYVQWGSDNTLFQAPSRWTVLKTSKHAHNTQ